MASLPIGYRNPGGAWRPWGNELLARRIRRIEALAEAAEEVSAEHAVARVAPVEEIVHFERKLPVPPGLVAYEELRHAVRRQGPVQVAIVLVPARILPVEPRPAEAKGGARREAPIDQQLRLAARDPRNRVAAFHRDFIGGIARRVVGTRHAKRGQILRLQIAI